MTRRELGILAAGGGAAWMAAAETRTVDAADLDPVKYTLDLYDSAPLELTFHATDRKEAEAWQKRLRAKVTELLGGFPAGRSALKAQTLEVRDFPDYRREKFVFWSRPHMAVQGYLLTPRAEAGPHATVICIPGHGRGVDDIVGIDSQGRDIPNKTGYQHDFALQVVEHGMAAVAVEPLAFGCRRDPATRRKGPSATACLPSAGAALLLGQTMIGWRVYDVMRTIDWIETRSELDAHRLGCMGISGGGTCTLFTAALDTRIRAAMVSGYLNTFRNSIMSVAHCIDNYIPGILNWAEMYDIAGLIAPRPLFVESGTKDDIFPIEASKLSFARVQKVYEVFGAAGNTEQEIFEGPHSFSGLRGLPFLVKQL